MDDKSPWCAVDDEGNFWFGGLQDFFVQTLQQIPDLLQSDDEAVRDRLYPATYVDADNQDEWRRHAVPELERLFSSRASLIGRDLASLRKIPNGETWFFCMPVAHKSAWSSGLNGARLALFHQHGLSPVDMELDPELAGGEAKADALLRIHYLGILQSLLLEHD